MIYLFLGLLRCKDLWIFSLFRGYCLCALYCFGAICCLARSLFYVTGEFHKFLHRGCALFLGAKKRETWCLLKWMLGLISFLACNTNEWKTSERSLIGENRSFALSNSRDNSPVTKVWCELVRRNVYRGGMISIQSDDNVIANGIVRHA